VFGALYYKTLSKKSENSGEQSPSKESEVDDPEKAPLKESTPAVVEK
jgi:hypothetical protein